MNKPELSVVIPTYNEAKYIERCLDSVIEQKVKNIEIIIVNDASTDGTLDLVKNYQKKYKFIRIINKTKNEKQMKARKDGCKKSRGKIILSLDGDSTLSRGYLKKILNEYKDKKVVAVGGGMEAINKETKLVKNAVLLDKSLYPNKKEENKFLMGVGLSVREEVYNKLGGYDENAFWAEDADFNLRLIKYAKKNDKSVVFLPSIYIKTEYPESIKQMFKRRYMWGMGRSYLIKKHTNLSFDYVYKILFLPLIVILSVLSLFNRLILILLALHLILPLFFVLKKTNKIKGDIPYLFAISYTRLIATSLGTIIGFFRCTKKN